MAYWQSNIAIIGFVSVLSCLRLNIAIPLPEKDEDAINLLALAMAAATMSDVSAIGTELRV